MCSRTIMYMAGVLTVNECPLSGESGHSQHRLCYRWIPLPPGLRPPAASLDRLERPGRLLWFGSIKDLIPPELDR